MIKRTFDSNTYVKLGHPDLGHKMYFNVSGKKRWGTVALLSFCGFKGASKGRVLLGIQPFITGRRKA